MRQKILDYLGILALFMMMAFALVSCVSIGANSAMLADSAGPNILLNTHMWACSSEKEISVKHYWAKGVYHTLERQCFEYSRSSKSQKP